MSIVANGWMDQNTTWCGGRPRHKRYCVRRSPSSPHGKRHSIPYFLAMLWHCRPCQQLLNSCSYLLHSFLDLNTHLRTYSWCDCYRVSRRQSARLY